MLSNGWEIKDGSREAITVLFLISTRNDSAFSIFTKLFTYTLILSSDKSAEITCTLSSSDLNMPHALITCSPFSLV